MPRKTNPALCATRGHLWKPTQFSRDYTVDHCARCPERQSRPPTPEEKASHKRFIKRLTSKRPSELHRLAWTADAIAKEKSGYPALQALERLAKKHPKRIFTAAVDDGANAGSTLTFITHEAARHEESYNDHRAGEPQWHGVSVYYAPQCTGEKPTNFFLYPCDLYGLIETLQAVKKHMLTFPEVRREMNRHARWRRLDAKEKAEKCRKT